MPTPIVSHRNFWPTAPALLGKPEPGLAHRKAAAIKNLTQLRPQLSWISDILHDGRTYIYGEAPSLADCVIYHPLWVMDQLAGEARGRYSSRHPSMDGARGRARPWQSDLDDRAHKRSMSRAASDPLPPLPSQTLDGDPALGDTVSITPTDYGRANPSVGTLVAIDAQRLALQHRNERTRLVTVHFPRFGYSVRALDG